MSPITNHNGNLDGTRIDLSYGVRSTLFGGSIVGLKGFYGYSRNTQNLTCGPGAGAGPAGFCDVLPLFDSNPNPLLGTAQNIFGSANGGMTFVTRRRADHWGIALELQPDRGFSAFGAAGPAITKAPATVVQAFTPKYGLAFRRIGQNISITATDVVFGTSLNYSERLDTNYWGSYLGLTVAHPVAGLIFSLDGEAGLYWAQTSYNGTMLTSAVNTGNTALTLSKNRAAFIGIAKAAVDKDFGTWKAGVFARAEWYSYAPEMNYNSLDVNGAFTNFSGPNNGGTTIGNSSAWTWSVGSRVAIKLH